MSSAHSLPPDIHDALEVKKKKTHTYPYLESSELCWGWKQSTDCSVENEGVAQTVAVRSVLGRVQSGKRSPTLAGWPRPGP